MNDVARVRDLEDENAKLRKKIEQVTQRNYMLSSDLRAQNALVQKLQQSSMNDLEEQAVLEVRCSESDIQVIEVEALPILDRSHQQDLDTSSATLPPPYEPRRYLPQDPISLTD